MRILFVDDEPRVLEALERMVMELVDDWEIECAISGEAALTILATAPFDVVVSDMRMPVMDGAALLQEVHGRYPHLTRIVLSGQTEQESALRALRVAHQFLGKPCRADVLVATIERTRALQSFVTSDRVRALAAGITSLPWVASNANDLAALMRDPSVSVAAVTDVICRDPGLAAKVLQLANSSFFSRAQPVADIATAVVKVGLETLRGALASGLGAPAKAVEPQDRVRRLQLDGVAAAEIAATMVPEASRGEAYTAALLSDVGQLVFSDGDDAGVSHAAVGAYLLGLWGLPRSLVDAVAAHHEPVLDGEREGAMASAVRAAHEVVAGESTNRYGVAA